MKIHNDVIIQLIKDSYIRTLDETEKRFGACLFYVVSKKFYRFCKKAEKENFSPECDESNVGRFIYELSVYDTETD